jgi:hypothetical protein
VLLLLDFPQAFDMVVHGLMLRNYSIGADMLVGSYLGERAQFVSSAGQDSRTFCWGCDVWSFSEICSWFALVYIRSTRGLSGIVVFTFMRMICRFIILVLCWTLQVVLMN